MKRGKPCFSFDLGIIPVTFEYMANICASMLTCKKSGRIEGQSHLAIEMASVVLCSRTLGLPGSLSEANMYNPTDCTSSYNCGLQRRDNTTCNYSQLGSTASQQYCIKGKLDWTASYFYFTNSR